VRVIIADVKRVIEQVRTILNSRTQAAASNIEQAIPNDIPPAAPVETLSAV
jgi:predicted ArsR family transcriptional regulator